MAATLSDAAATEVAAALPEAATDAATEVAADADAAAAEAAADEAATVAFAAALEPAAPPAPLPPRKGKPGWRKPLSRATFRGLAEAATAREKTMRDAENFMMMEPAGGDEGQGGLRGRVQEGRGKVSARGLQVAEETGSWRRRVFVLLSLHSWSPWLRYELRHAGPDPNIGSSDACSKQVELSSGR